MEPVARISLANQKGQQSKMKIKQILYHVRPLVSNDGLLDNSLIANWVYRFYFSPHFYFFFHLYTFYCHQTLKIVSQGPFARNPDNHFSCSGWRHLLTALFKHELQIIFMCVLLHLSQFKGDIRKIWKNSDRACGNLHCELLSIYSHRGC